MAPIDAVRDGIRCMLMRGGTSKGAYFLAADLPVDAQARDDLLLRVMGSPDATQIDGLGGANPLTSKVAVVSVSADADADLDYLFLQVVVDQPVVSDAQTCGNLLAGVAPFAVERGLVLAPGGEVTTRIRLINSGDLAVATCAIRDGLPDYAGGTAIDGVPGTAAPVRLELTGRRPLLPTEQVVDEIDGRRVTLVDNGMPVVLLRAADFGVTGDETPEQLEARGDLHSAVERVRLGAGPLMGLGDVVDQTVPKMILLFPARNGGTIGTRAFIPRRVHTSIGVLMAASVSAGISIPGAVGSEMAHLPDDATFRIEHPGGTFESRVRVVQQPDGTWRGASSSVRTARKIFDGTVFPRPQL